MNRQFLEEQAAIHHLTVRQRSVFIEMLIGGINPQETMRDAIARVAERVNKSPGTVSTILTEIYQIFGLDTPGPGQFYRLRNLLLEEYNNNYRQRPDRSFQTFEEVLKKWKQGKKIIYSAPAAVFFAGEHAVVLGHPAIYYPLPLRLYVHVEPEANRSEIFFNEYKAPNPNNIKTIDLVENITDYGRDGVPHQMQALNKLFHKIIYPFLREKTGFKIDVLTSFPIAVGLNSSGAFSVCFAQALVDRFLNLEEFKNNFNIMGAGTTKIVLTLAWAIGNCFHHFSSSGAGIHASFYGRQGKHPIIYCCSKRSNLVHRIESGYGPVNLGEGEEAIKNLLTIKTFVFDPAAPITYSTESANLANLPNNLSPYPSPPDYNITILYSGIRSLTESVLADFGGVRRFAQGSTERVHYVHEELKTAFPNRSFQDSVDFHSEILTNIYLNQNCENKDQQLQCAYKELMMEALGNLSIGVVNSVLSDWQFIPELMSSCQHLLSSGGVSTPQIDAFVTKLQAQAIQHQIDNQERLVKIAAKLTGAGKGGDILVLSLYEPEVHDNFLQRLTDRTIHFSCSVSGDRENFRVEGVRVESSQKTI